MTVRRDPDGEHDDASGGAAQARHRLGDHRTRSRPAQGVRGPDPLQGGRPVPLRRAHPPRGRQPHPLPARGRARGRGDRRGRRCRRHPRRSPATTWSPPTSRPAGSAATARPVTRTCATAGCTPASGCLQDETFRFHQNGEDFGGFCALGTFSDHTVVSEYSCVRIDDDIPFEVACLVGCGVTTGWCSAVRAGETRAGETVVVIWASAASASTPCRARATPAPRAWSRSTRTRSSSRWPCAWARPTPSRAPTRRASSWSI